ncbi:integrase, catalytic region, zinc finger, CCHC-type containing protein [Tanacetum coccineum]
MILESFENGPLIWPSVEENGVTRIKKYAELSDAEKIQADCDMKAINIILQGLPADIYSLANHHRSQMNHRTSYVPQIAYQSPRVSTQLITESPLVDSSFVVPVFFPGDDPIACLNKAMAFLTVVASSRFPSTNNQLKTSSNPRNQAIIQDGRVTLQQVQGRQGQSYSGTGYKSNATSSVGNNASGQARVVKCYNYQGEGHIARQCTQPKRPRNAAWYKDKAMLAEAQEAGKFLDEQQLAFLADPGVPDGQVVQTIIPTNAAFQTEDLDTYDSNCADISNAKAVFMANISNYGSDVISEANVQDTNLQAQQDSMILSVIEQMSEQMINHVNNWEKANKEQNNESVTAELERYKERVKTFEQRLNIDLSSREKMIDSQMDDMIKEKLALKEQVDSLEQNLSKQIKEKECLLQTFTVFKSESKEKEDKYMENEIDLEKKIKELDNILFKVGQSAQTVHMLTKPQAFYDNIHKQALGYQNPFYLKKAQRIKPTLYDGIVISDKHVAMHVIDDEETLILEGKSRSKISEKEKDPKGFKEHFDSIKKTRVRTKEQSDSLIDKLNLKSAENEDLKAQIQDELDLEHLAPRLFQNREAHIDYLKYTQEQAGILWGIIKQAKAKQPSHNALDFACCPDCSLIRERQYCKDYRVFDYQLGNITISRVYYIEGLGQNLFSIGQFCDTDLEVAIRKNTCFICNLEGVDLLSGSQDTKWYTISLDDMLKTSPIYLLSKASKTKSWLWHRRLSHLNFGTLNKLAKDGLARGIPRLKFQKDHMCSACALGKSKKSSHQPKSKDTN